MDLLTELAESIGGTAFELDVEDASAINTVLGAAADALGGLDAWCSPARWCPSHTSRTPTSRRGCMRSRSTRSAPTTCCARRNDDAVLDVAGADDLARADDEPRRARAEKADDHRPAARDVDRAGEHLRVRRIVRVGIGPTADTEILRGADRDLLSLLFRSWVEHGQLPAQMSALSDVANMLVSLVISAHTNPSVVPEIVQLSPRIRTTGSSA
jgi:hypothetical protein